MFKKTFLTFQKLDSKVLSFYSDLKFNLIQEFLSKTRSTATVEKNFIMKYNSFCGTYLRLRNK